MVGGGGSDILESRDSSQPTGAQAPTGHQSYGNGNKERPAFNDLNLTINMLCLPGKRKCFIINKFLLSKYFFSFSIASRRLRWAAMHVNLGQNFLNQLRKSTGNSLRICKDFNSISAFFSIDTNIEKTSRNAKFK